MDQVRMIMNNGINDYARIRSFINSFNKNDENEILADIYFSAKDMKVPVIREDMKELIRLLLLINKPKKILEIGTAVGYSASFMVDVLKKDVSIDTLELDRERILIAKENIKRLEFEDNINIIEGDAEESLKELSKSDINIYDMIFIDAAKGQYMIYLDEALKMSKPGTIIISDNILEDGKIIESHFLVEKREITIHDRIRQYLYRLKNDERLATDILSVGDGAAVSLVIKKFDI